MRIPVGTEDRPIYYQGFVNLTDMDESTGGNVVIPGSRACSVPGFLEP